MDSALKQRLLGAAVLIALAVIFVPMFLGKAPQQQSGSTLNLDIPKPPEHDFQTRTVAVDAPAAQLAPAPVADPDAVATVEAPAPAAVDTPVQDTGAAATGEANKPEPPAAVSKPAATTKPAAPAPAPAAPASGASGRYAIHLGVYADRGNAQTLVAALKKHGFHAYAETTEYQGKSALRVRVGPYADRAAVETARLKIKQFQPRVPSSIVETAASPATTDAPASALAVDRAGGWAVQVGAFKSEAEANKLRDRLHAAAFAAFIDAQGEGEARLWKVRAGPWADRAGADKARAAIDAKLKVKGIIVTQP